MLTFFKNWLIYTSMILGVFLGLAIVITIVGMSFQYARDVGGVAGVFALMVGLVSITFGFMVALITRVDLSD